MTNSLLLEILNKEIGSPDSAETLYQWTIDNECEDYFILEGEESITETGEKFIVMANNDFTYDMLDTGSWCISNLW